MKTKVPRLGSCQTKAPERTERTVDAEAVEEDDDGGGREIIDLVFGKLAFGDALNAVSRMISLEMVAC